MYVPGVHVFPSTGCSEEPKIEVLWLTPQTLGASQLALVPGCEIVRLIRYLSEAVSFQGNLSLTRGLFERQLPILVAEAPTIHEQAPYEEDTDSTFYQVEDRIRALLEADPVEDGYTHPAEILLEEIVRDWGQAAGDWLISVISDRRWNRSLAAGLLRLLSRQTPLSEAWRLGVIRSALSSPDIELRDAGVQAAESWEDPDTVELLQKHREPCTWLADYIERVIRDLMR